MDLLLNFDWIKKSHRVAHKTQRRNGFLLSLIYNFCCNYQNLFYREQSINKNCHSKHLYKIGVQITFYIPQLPALNEFWAFFDILNYALKLHRLRQIKTGSCKLLLPVSNKIGSNMKIFTTRKCYYAIHIYSLDRNGNTIMKRNFLHCT